jgi:hypothetical protein
MNMISLKKLNKGLRAEFPETVHGEKEKIQLYEITSIYEFNEISILRDWTDENDDKIAKNYKFIVWNRTTRYSLNEVAGPSNDNASVQPGEKF